MKITCSCGASLDISSQFVTKEREAWEKFLADHAGCIGRVLDIPAFTKRRCPACLQWVFGDDHLCPALQAAIHAAPPIRACLGCGCLVSGGPTRCNRCAKEAKVGPEDMPGGWPKKGIMDNTISFDFRECETCASKPGTPALCSSCLHNQWLIERLKDELGKSNAQHTELIMAVAQKWPNETRHQTALRYIREAEERAKWGPVSEVHRSHPEKS